MSSSDEEEDEEWCDEDSSLSGIQKGAESTHSDEDDKDKDNQACSTIGLTARRFSDTYVLDLTHAWNCYAYAQWYWFGWR